MVSGSPDFWIRGKYIELIETVNLIKTIETIEGIDLIDRITLIDDITNIGTIADITKVRGLHWYDRNPVSRPKHYYTDSIAPHSLTERWIYTVPADKIAWIDFLWLYIDRKTAANPVGDSLARFGATLAGTGLLPLAEIKMRTNNIGDSKQFMLAGAGILLEDDVLNAYTFEAGTGGTVGFELTAKITEFDV